MKICFGTRFGTIKSQRSSLIRIKTGFQLYFLWNNVFLVFELTLSFIKKGGQGGRVREIMQTRSSQNGFIESVWHNRFLFIRFSHVTDEMIIINRGAERHSVSVQLIQEADFIKTVFYVWIDGKMNAAYQFSFDYEEFCKISFVYLLLQSPIADISQNTSDKIWRAGLMVCLCHLVKSGEGPLKHFMLSNSTVICRNIWESHQVV